MLRLLLIWLLLPLLVIVVLIPIIGDFIEAYMINLSLVLIVKTANTSNSIDAVRYVHTQFITQR